MSNKRKWCECQDVPSRRQRKSLGRRKVCEVVEAASASSEKGRPPSFTKVLMSKFHFHTSSQIHCVMVIPRAFCDEHRVPNHVTMTDSTGHKLWHMRCQDRVATLGSYRIGSGWREFAYDHSLKLNDELVFTFIPPSHFVVEFATGAMRPTSGGKKYPWVSRNRYSVNMEAQARVTTSSPNAKKQTLEDDDVMNQSSTVKVENKKSILKDSSRKPPRFAELTHLECRNPDGTLYLQLLDSDGDGTDEDDTSEKGLQCSNLRIPARLSHQYLTGISSVLHV